MTERSPLEMLRERIARLEEIGSVARPVESMTSTAILADFLAVLDAPVFPSLDADERAMVIFRAHLIYSGTWRSDGVALIPSAERAAQALFADDNASLNGLCVAYDALFFFYWCWYTSLEQQAGFSANIAKPFEKAIVRRAAAPSRSNASTGPRSRKIGYLAEFVSRGPGNAVAEANKVILRALSEGASTQRPILYAWLFHDEDILAAYADQGIDVRAISGHLTAERIDTLRKMIDDDRPDVLLTDMNAALPTVLFAERVAPIQIFYQFGMPIWPLDQVDAVFHVWDFDFERAGLSGKRGFPMTVPYDLARFAALPDVARLNEERLRLPAGRLVGTYGRLSKITDPFIEAVAAGIVRHPDVNVVFGGSGDAGPIRSKVAQLGMADRFTVIEGYVDGHLWGSLLDVFLDTFPQAGGASCLEMIAKGKPVVGFMNAEAPNLSRDERVDTLVARDGEEYARILDRLLADREFYLASGTETRRLAARYHRPDQFARKLHQAIGSLRAEIDPQTFRERLVGRMRKGFRRMRSS